MPERTETIWRGYQTADTKYSSLKTHTADFLRWHSYAAGRHEMEDSVNTNRLTKQVVSDSPPAPTIGPRVRFRRSMLRVAHGYPVFLNACPRAKWTTVIHGMNWAARNAGSDTVSGRHRWVLIDQLGLLASIWAHLASDLRPIWHRQSYFIHFEARCGKINFPIVMTERELVVRWRCLPSQLLSFDTSQQKINDKARKIWGILICYPRLPNCSSLNCRC